MAKVTQSSCVDTPRHSRKKAFDSGVDLVLNSGMRTRSLLSSTPLSSLAGSWPFKSVIALASGRSLQMRLFIALGSFVFCSVALPAQDAKPTSIYTMLSGKNCRLLKSVSETGASVHECSGVGGYSLRVLEDDSRVSLTLISPDNKEHPLDFWTIVTKSLSTLGQKAEWRIARTDGKVRPVALIVRVNADIQEDPDKPVKKSYLVVTKITADQTCVTDRVDGSAGAKARQLADHSGGKACLAP